MPTSYDQHYSLITNHKTTSSPLDVTIFNTISTYIMKSLSIYYGVTRKLLFPILKRSVLSPRLFSKAIEIRSSISESVSPVTYAVTFLIYHYNHRNTLENWCQLNRSLLE